MIVLTSSLLDGTNSVSWGIRDFYLYAEPCPEGCVACTAGTLGSC